ncbi:CBS domain-containing protein [Myxococcus sp. CA051A]|uniref:CBS domain-containing protein n=1 Tax=Myxococcus llanfairpwllgwyngyllgogerychwyrndrobwllllantysiliogogogochensis TaxID=2590453 RepID=A0A540WLJ9_9BACT|nr:MULTISPECIES: CBS domain-containing protein [Myxococcus]NTX04425.1 CBS domain-containing protein [Myxococcus sp. CA040A]NTX12959.1 CBS domain-containing protein [Myxococcus sp. CA056]NTX36591.1 CBS domain-containing protein [Myxococcus sp. CA033]NTX57378.1 CBS domain-containing protein [Myxococcus sp. CA039A]NTX64897.1 CBS domain-containing protein [Myxococcus sp. CA051A]
MRIFELMTKNVETIEADESLRVAALRMRTCNIGSLPVTDGGQLVGMLTDRDITVRSTALGQDPNETRVREVMTTALITCEPDATLSTAEQLMEDKMVRRLVVVDEARRPLGILSLDDLATVPAELMRAGAVLEHLRHA